MCRGGRSTGGRAEDSGLTGREAPKLRRNRCQEFAASAEASRSRMNPSPILKPGPVSGSDRRQIELLEQVLPSLDHLLVVYPDVALARQHVDVRL